MILYRRNHFHVFGFTPRGNPTQRKQTVGLAMRYRRGNEWRHISAHFHYPRRDTRRGRGSVTFEVVTWRTRGGISQAHARVGLKAFVRLKIGLGGEWRELP